MPLLKFFCRFSIKNRVMEWTTENIVNSCLSENVPKMSFFRVWLLIAQLVFYGRFWNFDHCLSCHFWALWAHIHHYLMLPGVLMGKRNALPSLLTLFGNGLHISSHANPMRIKVDIMEAIGSGLMGLAWYRTRSHACGRAYSFHGHLKTGW